MDAETQTATNGAAKPAASELLSGPGRAERAASRIRASRAETMAALERGDLSDKPATPKTEAAAPESKPAPTTEAPPAEPAEPSEETPAEPAESTEKGGGEKPDPETAKRLASVQAAEKRSREKLAAERSKFESERAELAKERAAVEAKLAEFEAYRKARERAKIDPVSLLEAAGVDDLEYAAKQAYAKAKADPNNREAAARSLRERELADKIDLLQKRLDERDHADKQRAEADDVRVKVERYVGDLKKAATTGSDAPLAKHFLAKNPERTEQKLREIARDLSHELGDIPDIEDVLARYEKIRRAELEELGVDPATVIAAPKKNEQVAEKKPSAKTLGNDLSTPRVPRPRSSDREHRAETLALLESGKLE